MKTIKDFIGKHLLIGLNHLNAEGRLQKKSEFHGIVESEYKGGIGLRVIGKEDLVWVPPAYDQFKAADPKDVYTLKSTGEQITSVDFTGIFDLKPPPNQV